MTCHRLYDSRFWCQLAQLEQDFNHYCQNSYPMSLQDPLPLEVAGIQHLHIFWYCHIWSLRSHNRHHHWIHIKKQFQMIYNTCIFAGIAIYGHSDHTMDITIEFTLKNGSRWYITLVYLLVLPLHSTRDSMRCGKDWEGLEVESLWNPWDYWDSSGKL